MRKHLITLALIVGLSAAVCAVPQYLNFQGVLRDTDGNLVTGSKAMTFKIYDAATGGTEQFSMTSAEVTVSNGLYTVKLGPLGATELGSGSRWVEVTVGTQTLLPRLEILAVAYAITSGSQGSVDYAAVAGTATTAATATTANAVNGQVSAEASSGFALYIDGRVGATDGICVGEDEIGIGASSQPVANTNVTANSRIFITPSDTTHDYINNRGLRVKTITPGVSFVVETLDGNQAHATQPMPFFYLIIN